MLLRRVARPLLAGIFVYGGVHALRDPHGHAKVAQPVLDKIVERAPLEKPPSPVTLVRVDAGVKIGAGLLFGLGKAARPAALALASTLVPTTAAGHRFWEIEDPERRAVEQIQFLKNLGLLGGLLLASADTEGRPSLAWRARRPDRAARRASAAAGLGEVAGQAGGRLGEQTNRLLGEADKRGAEAAKRARKARKQTAKRLKQVSKQTDKRVSAARKRAAKRVEDVGKQADKRISATRKRAAKRAEQARAAIGA